MTPSQEHNDEHELKKIVDFYKGKDVLKADALLMDTAKNNFKQGYAKAIDDVLRIFDLCKGMTVEELKSSIAKLKEIK